MSKYLCSLFFDGSKRDYDKIFFNEPDILGFEPKIMDFFLNNEEGLVSDISYSKDNLAEYLKKMPYSIAIKNKSYDESPDYFWFKRRINREYNIYHASWLHENLEFVINHTFFASLLIDSGFIYGFCCNAEDMNDQSTENVRYLQGKFPKASINVKKNARGFLIANTEKNWGRSVYGGGLDFMAAPKMWFGRPFFDVISKARLMSFSPAAQLVSAQDDTIQIQLFNLYSNPAIIVNRNQQEKFWKFFDYKSVIDNYRRKKEGEIGITS